MLLSMTGYGHAEIEDQRLHTSVEIRAVNNRYLKISVKTPDAYSTLESRIERTIRKTISRGTVSITVRSSQVGEQSPYTINREVVENYWKQLREIAPSLHVSTPDSLTELLMLPGAITEESDRNLDPSKDWDSIEKAIGIALESFQQFRKTEGEAMQADLCSQIAIISKELEEVDQHAPTVVKEYREKMLERVQNNLREVKLTVEEKDIIREVAIFSDRCDINEEIARLRSHLGQFRELMNDNNSQGRKLDFLSQEAFREVNTIGSKANNALIAQHVVEMKASIEKIREVLQNIE